MRFSWSTHLLMFFVLGHFNAYHENWLTYILLELINLVNYVIFLFQKTLTRWLTFLLEYQTVIFIVLLFWINSKLLTLVFVLQWLSLHWEILIILLSQFPLTFYKIHIRNSYLNAYIMSILVLIAMVFIIIWEMFHGRISLSFMLLLLLVNFLSRFRLELMYISLIENTTTNLTLLHGFQLFVLLP